MPRLASFAGNLAAIPFDFHELVGALAPRAFFVNAPGRDAVFNWQSVDRVVAAARPIYALFDASERITVEHPDCAHDFPEAMREKSYAWLQRFLR
jgi:hypothetical protein